MNLSWTQRCVLRVIFDLGGSSPWIEVTNEVRRRSGRTVRPNLSTLRSLVNLNLLTFGCTLARLTDAGRAIGDPKATMAVVK